MADDKPDSEKTQREFLEALRKMVISVPKQEAPQSEGSGQEEDSNQAKNRARILEFNLRPKDVKKHLDRYVIKQDEAKRVLSTAICDHYNHIKGCDNKKECGHYVKQNVILLGPTGVGKTYLIRSLAELVGVPFVKADATKFSETGYVGGDTDDLIRELVHRSGGDISLAQYGIVYVDEIDKIATPSNLLGRDVSGSGVQRGLLKIMEETEVPLRGSHDIQSQMQSMMEFQQKGKFTRPVINTKHILFIVSGAFTGLESMVEKRIRSRSIGFSVHADEASDGSGWLRRAATQDLMDYGFEPEFVGRLPVRVVCDPLDEKDLFLIMKNSEGSIIHQYENSFMSYGIRLAFENEALREIAAKAVKEGTGARGLVTVCERVFRDLKFELPSTSVKELSLTQEMVLKPQDELVRILKESQNERRVQILQIIRAYEETFQEKHGIRVKFDAEACLAIQARVLEDNLGTASFLDQLLTNYPYGLGLIQKKAKNKEFVITARVIANPNRVLDEWIRESYEG